MLNLFSYGEEDEDEYGLRFCVQCSEKSIKEQKEATTIPEQTGNSRKKEKSSNAASEKKSKKRKVLNIEKITGVSMDELMKEEEEEEKPSSSQASNSKLSSVSKPLNLPNPKKSVNGSSKEDSGDSAVPISDENGPVSSSEESSSGKQTQTQAPTITYKTVYRTSTPSTVSVSAPAPASTPAPPITSGYGGTFSQSQYEAFMRRSGMLDTVNAESTSSIEFMGENMKCYDKEMIRALKDGSVIELDSNSIHNHLEQPGNEYWEHREKRAKIAEQFGKYAHTAPTQLQQTRNQISYLATKAIDDLMDLDKRRANARKTRKEIRAKYGW